MGSRVAHLVRGAGLDYIEIDENYAMVKMSPTSRIVGKRLGDTGVRAKYGITVAAFQQPGENWRNADMDTVLLPDDTILVADPIARAEEFGQLR